MRRKPDESQPTSLKSSCGVVRGLFSNRFRPSLLCAFLFPFLTDDGCSASGRLKVRCCGKDSEEKSADGSATFATAPPIGASRLGVVCIRSFKEAPQHHQHPQRHQPSLLHKAGLCLLWDVIIFCKIPVVTKLQIHRLTDSWFNSTGEIIRAPFESLGSTINNFCLCLTQTHLFQKSF